MRDDPLAAWLDADDGEASRPADDDWRPPPEPSEADRQIQAGAGPWAQVPDFEEPERSGRRRVFLAAAAVWGVVAVLAVAVWGGEADMPSAPRTEPTAVAASPAVPSAAPARPAPSASPAHPAPGPPLDPALAAAAEMAVRRAVTTGGDSARYVDAAAAESVQAAGPLVVVRVLALLVEGSGGRWERTRTARYAVPVDPRVGLAAAPPWALSAPRARPQALSWRPATGRPSRAALQAAAEVAGYEQPRVLASATAAALPGVVRVTLRGRAPGERAVGRHQLWVRRGEQPTVMGGQQ